jgi:crotonobetainyl-CoA:carnitine CoA-transferase CaiB-like acyl-CoA transferase
MDGPLSGTTVVEFCHSVAGPYAASILADLGADVVKVESPTGDYARDWGPPFSHGTSTLFHVLNHNKRGLALDLRDGVTVERLKAFILERADVVIQNLRPGAIDKLGLGAAALRAEKPALIYCDLGAYGRTGPLRERPGYDPLMQAHGGIMSVTGVDGGEPVRVGVSIVDQGAGMWAALGIVAALNRRHVTGAGCHVTTSLFETALGWMAPHIGGYLSGGAMRRPLGSGVTEIVPHQAFPTADGHVMVAAGNDNLFGALCGAIERTEFARDARFATNSQRVENRRVLVPMLENIFRTRRSSEWLARLDAAGVPAAPIENVAQVVASPQTAALGMLQKDPQLDLTITGLPLEFDGARPPYRFSAPELGEHNDLLAEPTPRKAAS